VRLIVFRSFYAFRHRFHRVDTCSTAANPLPRRISCFETHVDHPQKWDFWIYHRRPAEKEPNRVKQLYIRLTGSRAVTNRYTSDAQSPAPGTSHFGIGCDILEDRRDLGIGFGSFFLCLVVWLFVFYFFLFFIFLFFFVVTCGRLSLCLFFGFITSCSLAFFLLKN
jgi:hypothetical protein